MSKLSKLVLFIWIHLSIPGLKSCFLKLSFSRSNLSLPRGGLRVFSSVRVGTSVLFAHGRQDRVLGIEHTRSSACLLYLCLNHLFWWKGEQTAFDKTGSLSSRKPIICLSAFAGVWSGHPVLRAILSGAVKREAEDPAGSAHYRGEEDDPRPACEHQ